MKGEIEKRRAEAAEKRQKVEDCVDGEDRPFKCVSPRGSSLKVGPFPNRAVRVRFKRAVAVWRCSCSVRDRAPWSVVRATEPLLASKVNHVGGFANSRFGADNF